MNEASTQASDHHTVPSLLHSHEDNDLMSNNTLYVKFVMSYYDELTAIKEKLGLIGIFTVEILMYNRTRFGDDYLVLHSLSTD